MNRSTRALVLAIATLLGVAIGPTSPSSGSAQVAEVAASGSAHSFVVVIQGLRSDHGVLLGGLYDRATTWLGENQSIEDCRAPIVNGRARCVFHAASEAVAFAALHDEDGDGELGRDLIGLPTEGYGFSNDARDPFGPPSFAAASFSPERLGPCVVHVRYGI